MSATCILGENCDAFDFAAGTPEFSGEKNLCETCNVHFAAEVNLLRYDYVDLSQIIARRNGNSDVKIARPKPGSVPPIDVNIYTLRSDIVKAALESEDFLRIVCSLPRRNPLGVREGYNVDQAVRIIAPRVDTLAGLTMSCAPSVGILLLSGLRVVHRRARTVLGLAEHDILLPGICPQCSAYALSRANGSDAVVCGSCRNVLPLDVYQKMVTLTVTQVPTSACEQPVTVRDDER